MHLSSLTPETISTDFEVLKPQSDVEEINSLHADVCEASRPALEGGEERRMKTSKNQELPDNGPQNISRECLILQLGEMLDRNPLDFYMLLANVYLIADRPWKDPYEAQVDLLADFTLRSELGR
jgi:hypothetical protein